MLAFYLSLILNLDSATWSVVTVMVLMGAQYVGALLEKSLFRLLGTLVGGVIGSVLLASTVQNGFLAIPLMFLTVGIFTYMFGSPNAPYAYFLCALTTVVITAGAISEPANVFQVAISRVIEITIGILCAVLVSVLIWPRHAADEFRIEMVNTIHRIRWIIAERAREEVHSPKPTPGTRSDAVYSSGFRMLRELLHFATLENGVLHRREALLVELLAAISAVHSGGLSLLMRPTADRGLIETLRPEFQGIVQAIDTDLSVAEQLARKQHAVRPDIGAAFEVFESRLGAMRDHYGRLPVSDADLSQMSQLYLTLCEIRERLDALHAVLEKLATEGKATRDIPSASLFELPHDPAWISIGIKGGTAFIVSLLLNQWLQPPGQISIPTIAWVFTALSRGMSNRAADQRAFHVAAGSVVLNAVLMVVLLTCWPLLSSSFGLALFLGGTTFAAGYLTGSSTATSFPYMIAMFVITGIVGLNADDGVPFSSILNVVFSVSIGLMLAACVQRLMWPTLPQHELRKCLERYFEGITRIFPFGRRSSEESVDSISRLALIPNECRSWIAIMREPRGSRAVRDHLVALVNNLHELNFSAQGLRRVVRFPIHESLLERVEPVLDAMDNWIATSLRSIESALRRGGSPEPVEGNQKLCDDLNEVIRHVRNENLMVTLETKEVVQFFGLTERYLATMEDVNRSQRQLAETQVPRWAGDYVL